MQHGNRVFSMFSVSKTNTNFGTRQVNVIDIYISGVFTSVVLTQNYVSMYAFVTFLLIIVMNFMVLQGSSQYPTL